MTRTPDFNQEMDRFQDQIPAWVGRNLKRLCGKHAVWVRVPAGVALIGGGVLSFLPVLGIWMLPLGVALLGGRRLISWASLIATLRNGRVRSRRDREPGKLFPRLKGWLDYTMSFFRPRTCPAKRLSAPPLPAAPWFQLRLVPSTS